MNLKPSASTSRVFYTVFALVASVLYDVFLWDHAFGLGFFVFVALFVAGFLAVAFFTKQLHTKLALWLLVPITILSGTTVVYANDFVQSAVPLAVFILTLAMMLLTTVRNPDNHPFAFWSIPVVRRANLSLTQMGAVIRDVVTPREVKHNESYKKIAIGVIVALPILMVFLMLFASADAVFSQMLERVFNFVARLNIDQDTLWRVVRTIGFTLVLSSLLYVILSDDHKLTNIVRSVRKLDSVIISTVLALVNILFLLFVCIQLRYLFGSADFVIAQGMTYADYARSGFFELAWVMVFSAGLITVCYRSQSQHGHSQLATVLKVLLAVQVEIIAISALKRMYLYQEAYGFTTDRLYVEWFIYFVMTCLAGLAGAILARLSFRQVFHGALLAGLVAFTIVASINVDGRITNRNIARYKAGGTLDAAYLMSLSTDGYPQLAELFKTPQDMVRVQGYSQGFYRNNVYVIDQERSYANVLRVFNLREAELTKKYDSWFEINLSVRKAQKALAELP